MKVKTLEVKVYTAVGLLTAVLVKDIENGYTIFFKEKEWDNLISEGQTIDDSITNLLNLFDVVQKYKKDRKSAVDFGNWIHKNRIVPSKLHPNEWYCGSANSFEYVQTTEELYDKFLKEFNKPEFDIIEP